jgi:NADPH-dependent 2,4-dienoyl-CoA reductase/sulfur reductase-like enzyme
MTETNLDFEIVVVGAGPAGMAAACAAAESHKRVALVDETPWLGGQIWRGQQPSPKLSSARAWFDRFERCGAKRLDQTCVIAAPTPGLLLAERAGQPLQVRYARLVVATGARELFLPFPGWTLPGVTGPGGLLSLTKHGWPVKDQRIVIAGSGPLLLAAAQGLIQHGADVVTIVEQADWSNVARFGVSLYKSPAKLWQALKLRLGLRRVRFEFGTWPIHAEGTDQVRRVTFTNGRRTWTVECDQLACGFGMVPNVELPLALGCELEQGFVRVDQSQGTSRPDVFCAGEPTGIGGADCALVEGQIAGHAAAGKPARAESLFRKRAAWHHFRKALAQTFSLRPELKTLASPVTVVCRCEDVTLAQLRQFSNWREAKLQSRCGMGPCQGRVCGPAVRHLLGWNPDSVRPPVSPARVHSLISS